MVGASHWRGLFLGAALVCVALLMQGCDRGPETTDVTVWLDWAEEPTQTFTTDLGYSIELTRLDVTTYSVELIPCDLQLFQDLQNGIYATQASLTLVSQAQAAHADPDRPTRTNGVEVETPLTTANAIRFADLTPPAFEYCRLHYLIGRVPNDAPSPSAGVSLWVEGRYVAPNGQTGPIQIKSAMAFGRNVDLTDPSGVAFQGVLATPTEVRVGRSWRAAFNGIRLEETDGDTLTRHILRELIRSVTVTARTGGES